MFILSAAIVVLFQPNAMAKFPSPEEYQVEFYSPSGKESRVSFRAEIRTNYTSLDQIQNLSVSQKSGFEKSVLPTLLKYIYGPLTNRGLGSPQRGATATIDWMAAHLVGDRVNLFYDYRGSWILQKNLGPATIEIPVPFDEDDLFSTNWKRCSDSDPEHQTYGFFWYFWDPQRYGCDHKVGQHYQQVKVSLGDVTPNTSESRPEYSRLINSDGDTKKFQMTFGFGYVEDPVDPKPDTDFDPGAREYQRFLSTVRASFAEGMIETPITTDEYESGGSGKVIGHRFEGVRLGVQVTLKIVMSGAIDQMEIFAKSFAHDHDGFFGWFGHSRVGSAFDAQAFGQRLQNYPEYYSVTSAYQIVYWAGCSSYSYYTRPFFDFKAKLDLLNDPHGTKNLDIIANGLPSYFSLNSTNGLIVLRRLMDFITKEDHPRTTYQQITSEIEQAASQADTEVLVAILGDEDNP